MTILERLLAKPRTFAARGWIFQVHLYCGLAVALYVLVIGLTGSVLVFAPEMRDWQNRELRRVNASGTRVPAEQVLESVKLAHPRERISLLYLPTEERGTFRLSVGESANRRTVYVDPFTARIVGERREQGGLLAWLESLHFDLLGGSTGRTVNGVFGLIAFLMCATGIVVWWPGKAYWSRAMSINWRARWKRMNYDIHSATGFFTVPFLVLLSLTGAFFAWPDLTRALVSSFSTVKNGAPSPPLPQHGNIENVRLSTLLETSARAVPDSWNELIILPAKEGQALRVYMMSGSPQEYQTTSVVDLDPKTGEAVHIERAKGRSAGDTVMAWLSVLHFGSFGGVPVKLLWVLLGLTPAILGVSGSLMWWNRVAVKRVSKWRSRRDTSATEVKHLVEEDAENPESVPVNASLRSLNNRIWL